MYASLRSGLIACVTGMVLCVVSKGEEKGIQPPEAPSALKAAPYVHYIEKKSYWWEHFEASKAFAVALIQANPKLSNDEVTHRAYNLADQLMILHGYTPSTNSVEKPSYQPQGVSQTEFRQEQFTPAYFSRPSSCGPWGCH